MHKFVPAKIPELSYVHFWRLFLPILNDLSLGINPFNEDNPIQRSYALSVLASLGFPSLLQNSK